VSDNGRVHIPPELLHQEIARIAEQGASAEEAQELLDMIVEETRTQSRLITLGLLRARVGRFLRQAELLEAVEEKLYDETRLRHADTDDLIKIHRQISSDVFKTLEQIMPDLRPETGEDGKETGGLLGGNLHLHLHKHEAEKQLDLPRRSRENLVSFFTEVDHALRGKGRALNPAPEEDDD
jgi:hypothetical protein